MKNKLDNVRTLNVRLSGNLDRFKYDNFNYVVTLHNVFEKSGVLPFEGAFSQQPAKIVEIFNVLDQLSFEKREQIQKENQKEAKKNV